MLNHKNTTHFDVANISTLFEQFGEVIKNYTQDFITLQRYANTPIKSEKEVIERAEIMDELADMAKDNDDIVMTFVNSIADRIEEYENENLVIPKHSPSEVLAGLMKIKNIKQVDLKDIAKQGVISDLLNKKRAMNIKQIKGFAEFFNVPTSLFMG